MEIDQDIKICISTCRNYAPSTIPNIISSLKDAGIYMQNILVVEGDNQTRKVENKDYMHCYVEHNSFDLTSLIEVVESHYSSKWWLLLHDTCVVGKSFRTCLARANENVDRVALLQHPSMSIGLYKYEFLLQHAEKINSYKTFTTTPEERLLAKHKAFESEDVLLWKLPCGSIDSFGHNRVSQLVNADLWKMQRTENRIQEYFPQLDIYKLKANYGQGGTPIINL